MLSLPCKVSGRVARSSDGTVFAVVIRVDTQNPHEQVFLKVDELDRAEALLVKASEEAAASAA